MCGDGQPGWQITANRAPSCAPTIEPTTKRPRVNSSGFNPAFVLGPSQLAQHAETGPLIGGEAVFDEFELDLDVSFLADPHTFSRASTEFNSLFGDSTCSIDTGMPSGVGPGSEQFEFEDFLVSPARQIHCSNTFIAAT